MLNRSKRVENEGERVCGVEDELRKNVRLKETGCEDW